MWRRPRKGPPMAQIKKLHLNSLIATCVLFGIAWIATTGVLWSTHVAHADAEWNRDYWSTRAIRAENELRLNGVEVDPGGVH